MPTYDYRCKKCGHRFELVHSIKDDAPKKCPKCRARAQRVPSVGAGLLFKGSGFYITDYRSSSYKEKAKSDKEKAKSEQPSASGSSGGTEAGKPAGKPARPEGNGTRGKKKKGD